MCRGRADVRGRRPAHVWVQAQVYEDQLGLVRVGQEVEATVEAFPGQVFQGKVAFIHPAFDPTTRTVEVRYDLDNPGRRLRPGMFATVTLEDTRGRHARRSGPVWPRDSARRARPARPT